MGKSKRVYQYDLFGNFIKEFSSVEEAAREIQGRTGRIRDVASEKKNHTGGFQWRYKNEVQDRSKKIGLGKYNIDDEMKRLYKAWYSARWSCHSPKGRYYETDLSMCERWRGSFDNFYYDMIGAFREAHNQNPEYKNEINCHHIWLARKDKTRGWREENVEFMTPDVSSWHKEETIKIVRGGRTVTVPQIAEELATRGIHVSPGTLHARLRDNRGLEEPNKQAQHKFNGKYYSLVELAGILDFDREYVQHKLRDGLGLMEAIRAYQEYKKYSFRGKAGLTRTEYIDELEKHCDLKRGTINDRINRGYSAEKILKFGTTELVGRANRIKVAQYFGGQLINEFDSVGVAGEETGIGANDISRSSLYDIRAEGFVFQHVGEEGASRQINIKMIEERELLLNKWLNMRRGVLGKGGAYYKTGIKISERWKESFNNFFNDNIKRFLEARERTKKAGDGGEVWFSRKDKEGHWRYNNTHFVSPKKAQRLRSNSLAVEVEGEVLTPEEISQKLKREKGIDVTTQTIRQRIESGKNVMDRNHDRKYKYNGEFYALTELSKMLNFNYDYVKARINKHNEPLEEAIESYKNYYGYSLNGKENLTRPEYVSELVKETGLARATVNYRLKNGYSEEEILTTPLGGNKGKGAAIKIGKFKNGEKIEEFNSLTEASKTVSCAYTTFTAKVKEKEIIDGFLFKKI